MPLYKKGGQMNQFTFTSAADLRGKQSVRATFRLSARTIEAVSIIATHLGIKQKSLFDHLMDDMQTMESIANQIESQTVKQPRIQKTYVISRKTLSCLEAVALEHQAPRDTLIEYSVQRLMPLIQQEKEKHRSRKAILKELKRHTNKGLELLKKTEESLGKDDLVYENIASAIALSLQAQQNIEAYIQRGEIIEQFEIEPSEEDYPPCQKRLPIG